MSFTLAIVGRPNVGKSTLFNRLVGKKLALVDDQPGVTRDLREGDARLFDLRFTVIDTAGLEDIRDDSLQGRMRRLTEKAVDMADTCLFLIDGRSGVTPLDRICAEILRKSGKPVVLGVNKTEGKLGQDGVLEAWELGLGEPISLSAEHGLGLDEMYDIIRPLVDELQEKSDEVSPLIDVDLETADDDEDHQGADDGDIDHYAKFAPSEKHPLQIAVIGRPNAGKSTLINKIVGDDRLLTGPEAGITRDAISIRSIWNEVPIRIFDTAGMRKRAKIVEKLEKLSVSDGLRAVRFAEVVVILLDAEIPFEQQDLRIADFAANEGRAVVIAVNKWDLEEEKQKKLFNLKEMFERLLPQLRGAPLVALSAKTGKGLDRLYEAIISAHKVWNRRISTARLNSWLGAMVEAHPPPAPGGRRIKLKFITQAKTRPPGFVIKCSRPDELDESYRRYLINGLRSHFDLPGTPIRLFFRGQGEENPFRNRKFHTPSRLRKHVSGKRFNKDRFS